MARKPKGDVARSETLAIRLDPRTRYMLELAGRIQHRTLSSVVEWMINNSLKDILVDDARSLASVQADLWDIDEADRLVKLAIQYPHLLNFEEQRIWKVIAENSYFWTVNADISDGVRWTVSMQSVNWKSIRDNWQSILGVVRGDDNFLLPKLVFTKGKTRDDNSYHYSLGLKWSE